MKVVYEGPQRSVVWVEDEAGKYRGEEYLDKLKPKDRAAICMLFERMGVHGKIHNEERFRLEQDGIYCFKRFQDRLFCFFDERLICVTHGYKKKRDRVPPAELDKAKRIRSLYLEKKD